MKCYPYNNKDYISIYKEKAVTDSKKLPEEVLRQLKLFGLTLEKKIQASQN